MMTDDTDDNVYLCFEAVLKHILKSLPNNGGFVTVKSIASRLPASLFDGLPASAREDVVRRALEMSVLVHLGRKVHAFIGINKRTGKVISPRRPRGVPAVADLLLFEPEQQ